MTDNINATVEPMRLRAEPPRVTRLSRKVLIALGLLAGTGIGGTLMAKIIACLMRKKAKLARRTSDSALLSLCGRSSQLFRRTKAMAAFWPLPKKEKPATPMTCATSGCLR